MVPMTVSTRMAAAFAGLLLTGLSNEIQAATVTYDFATVSSEYSPTKDFTALGGPDLTVSANTVSADGSVITPVAGTGNGVGQWAGLGLGTKNGSNDNSHTVDGYGLNDLLVLTFSSSVRIVSASFNYAGQIANSYDGFAFFADDNDIGSDIAGDMVFSHGEINAVNYSGSYDFVANGFGSTGTIFGIGAIWDAIYQSCYRRWGYNVCKNYTLFDSFKLASVTVETGPFDDPPEVPLPAGVILLLSGLTGLGFIKRFKGNAGA
jgi:hypothetical protein